MKNHMVDRVQVDQDNIPVGNIPRFARKHFWHNLEIDVEGFDDPDADNDSDDDGGDGGGDGLRLPPSPRRRRGDRGRGRDGRRNDHANEPGRGASQANDRRSSRRRQDPAPSSSRRQNPTPSSSRQDGAPVRIASRAEAGQGTAADNKMNDGFGEVKVEDGESDGLSDVEDLGDDVYQDVKDEAKDEVENELRLNLYYADMESEDSDVVFLSSRKVSSSRSDGVYSESPSKRARGCEHVGGAWKRISWGCETLWAWVWPWER
ncbi:hypothetical protein DL98DRAFT_597382 [Cadophora sp. DSE1049]|nr:hypothetical protein DL98DRAFT_597382 [Cadophora sp. DSE1049]